MDILDLTNYAFLIAGLTTALLGLILSLGIRRFNRWNRFFFTTLFTVLIVYLSFTLVMLVASNIPDPALTTTSKISLYVSSLTSSLLMPMLTLIIVKTSRPDTNLRKCRIFVFVIAMWFIYFVLLAVTQFTKFIYYFTPDNVYHRGPFYFLLLVPPAIIMGGNLVELVIRHKSFSRRQLKGYIIYIALPLVGMILQMFFFGLLSIALCSVLAALWMFVFILEDHVDKVIEQANDNAKQKANILALQMRPHFIYNTLTSIYYLCDQSPEKAQQTILNFTTYLRRNFTAIASKETVSFNDELEHTKAYIAVEQVRFEDEIEVIYDITYTSFRLPALTLQPLVENAIKHGLDPEQGPMEVIIRTIKTDNSTKLIVENTGSEFSERENNDPHIALENLIERLNIMCNATLTIEPKEGGGTIVTVEIPD